MADIDDTKAAQSTKVVGSDTDGTEQTPVSSTPEGRLKVENTPADGTSIIPSLGTNLSYDDMNTDTGGVARDTLITNAWTKVYDSTLAPTPGTAGLLLSFIITLESFGEDSAVKAWAIRMVVDGFEVFGPNGILSTDLTDISVYGLTESITTDIPPWGGFNPRGNSLRWQGPVSLPISYSSGDGVQIYIKKLSEDRRFRAGLAVLTKE